MPSKTAKSSVNPANAKSANTKAVNAKVSASKGSASKPSGSKPSASKPSASRVADTKVATAKAAPQKPAVKTVAPNNAASKTVDAKTAAPKTAASKTASPTAAVKPVIQTAAKPGVLKPAVAAAKPAAVQPRVEEPKKVLTQRQGFKTGEFVVYPAHGVGQILAIEEQEIAGAKLELFVINFMKDKMTLRVPTAKVANVGMRKLSEPALVKRALETLKGRARIKRTMWSRRAQEYEAKINSGDIVAIAEVVRDLFRSDSQPEQSYSERQLYEAALDRLSREIAVVQHVTETEAVKEIEGQLAKSPRRGAKTEAGAEGDADTDAEADGDSAVADEAA